MYNNNKWKTKINKKKNKFKVDKIKYCQGNVNKYT